VAIALPSIKTGISSLFIARITAIIFIFSGALAFNALYIQSIGSGIGIYSGLFQVTLISQFFDVFILFLGAMILIGWPLINSSYFQKIMENVISFTSRDESSLSLSNNNNLLSIKKNNLIGLYTPKTEYSLILLFSALGSTLLLSSADLLSMYLSIELQSFSLYLLATLYRDYESATAAGLKYFLLGALSSCFILLGCGLIYSFTGLTNFESIYSLISSSFSLSNNLNNDFNFINNNINYLSGLNLGIIFIFIGFLFKIAAAPLHSWSPDVYDETPTQVTTWLTVIPKIAILILFLELYTGFTINSLGYFPININFLSHLTLSNGLTDISLNSSYVLKQLILISAVFSLIIGTLVGLSQIRIKRLLAYSTISHVGFILLALAINTQQSIESFIFYLLQYSLTNLNIFLIILALGYLINKDGFKLFSNNNNIFVWNFDIRYISTLTGQININPILTLSLIICLFSMAGIPPLLGFFGKQFVLLSAIDNGYWFISIIAIITSVISASYYLRVIIILITEFNELNIDRLDLSDIFNNPFINSFKFNNQWFLTNFHSFIIATFTLSILLFIFKPNLLLNSTQILSLSLFF
jgi:NADH-ubiquinone oxidoreductase chain 2